MALMLHYDNGGEDGVAALTIRRGRIITALLHGYQATETYELLSALQAENTKLGEERDQAERLAAKHGIETVHLGDQIDSLRKQLALAVEALESIACGNSKLITGESDKRWFGRFPQFAKNTLTAIKELET